MGRKKSIGLVFWIFLRSKLEGQFGPSRSRVRFRSSFLRSCTDISTSNIVKNSKSIDSHKDRNCPDVVTEGEVETMQPKRSLAEKESQDSAELEEALTFTVTKESSGKDDIPREERDDSSSCGFDYELFKSLDQLGQLLCYIDKILKEPSDSYSSDPEAPEFVERAIELAGDFLSKLGGSAARGRRQIQASKDEALRKIAQFFDFAGNVHFIGVLLSGITFLLQRRALMNNNRRKWFAVLTSMRDLGATLVAAIPTISNDPGRDIHYRDIIRDGVDFVFECLRDCLEKRAESRYPRFVLCEVTQESLDAHRKQIESVYSRLNSAISSTLLKVSHQTDIEPVPLTEELKDKVGLEPSLLEIVKLLNFSGQEAVRAVILHGMGGIGKSTLGKAVYNHFTAVKKIMPGTYCFVEMPTPTVSDDNTRNIYRMQRKILKSLKYDRDIDLRPPTSMQTTSHDVNQSRLDLLNCFKSKKNPVFIFIDSVERQEDLKLLLPTKIDQLLPKGSRILLATRNARVSGAMMDIGIDREQVKVHEMKVLGRELARQLFCRHVFGDERPPVTRQRDIQVILDACGGLPLALEVIGGYLRCSDPGDKYAWEWACQSLKKLYPASGSEEERLIKTLELSYKSLSQDLRDAFLDIIFCFNGSPWSDLQILYGNKLNLLNQRALVKKELKVLKGIQYYCASVHDLLVGVGYKKISESGSHVLVKKFRQVLDPVKKPNVLMIQGEANWPPWPAHKLDRISRSLRILIIIDVKIEGNNCQVPHNLECFICDKSSVPFPMGNIKGLTYADISNNEVDECFTFPPALKKLRLSMVPSLRNLKFPDGICSLEQLGLLSCGELEESSRNTKFPYLGKLVIKDGSSFSEALLSDFGKFKALETLSLQNCAQIPSLVQKLHDLLCLRLFHINSTKLKDLPKGIWYLPSSEIYIGKDVSSLRLVRGMINNQQDADLNVVINFCRNGDTLSEKPSALTRISEPTKGGNGKHEGPLISKDVLAAQEMLPLLPEKSRIPRPRPSINPHGTRIAQEGSIRKKKPRPRVSSNKFKSRMV